MRRWVLLCVALTVAMLTPSVGSAQKPIREVFGTVENGNVRVFLKDTLYRVSGDLVLKKNGTLIIEPGTEVEFLPNGRVVVHEGGRLLADGKLSATYDETFNPLNDNVTYPLGYADLGYFNRAGVVNTNALNVVNEPTVHSANDAYLFGVSANNVFANLPAQSWQAAKAMMYVASRIQNAGINPDLRNRPWRRANGATVNIAAGRIKFRGNPVNDFSREWGHIVVLPGAKSVYFRDCDFENFRKDTTVDRLPYYTGTSAAAEALNREILAMTNGSGAVITTFSVRTWLVGCRFSDNEARYHGGAVQILQAPLDNAGFYPQIGSINDAPFYNAVPQANANNRNITEPDGSIVQQQVRAIDRMAQNIAGLPAAQTVFDLNDEARQRHDDARIAVLLGRVRGLLFERNVVRVQNVNVVPQGVARDTVGVANIDAQAHRNEAYGGALYIAGRTPIEIGFGINNFYDNLGRQLSTVEPDYVGFNNNRAINLQGLTPQNNRETRGARGGAVYVGDATSVIFSGKFENNSTVIPNNANKADFSQGGGVYVSANSPRIQIRGGLQVGTGSRSLGGPMHFVGNNAGRGGAIYAFLITPTSAANLRPVIIGGSDSNIPSADFRNGRDYGYNILFENNVASEDGGAIYANKAIRLTGAGGVVGTNTSYGPGYKILFKNNRARYSGGAISVNIFGQLSANDRRIEATRIAFEGNFIGLNADRSELNATQKALVRGGGAVYSFDANFAFAKALDFLNNEAHNGNGGAVALVLPTRTNVSRAFVTDMDIIQPTPISNYVSGFTSNDALYTQFKQDVAGGTIYPDARSLTRFIGNVAAANMDQMGSGSTQNGDVARLHPGTPYKENGTGLGGAIYILDTNSTGVANVDNFEFNRVRFQNNSAYSGAVAYSDNYGLGLIFQRCLITGNKAVSEIGLDQNQITGPFISATGANPASSDLAGAVIYGEVQGPLPANQYHTKSNSIYDNAGRFLIRLPDAPNTKGTLAGLTGVGRGAVDTLKGNFWGKTGADVVTRVNIQNGFVDDQYSFFIEKKSFDGSTPEPENLLPFRRGGTGIEQGPFESIGQFTYTPLPVGDVPERALLQGHIYDLFDKGTDIKTADYSNRRMSRIEDFSVGIPAALRTYSKDAVRPALAGETPERSIAGPIVGVPYVGLKHFTAVNDYAGKVVRRWVRDPHIAGNPYVIDNAELAALPVNPDAPDREGGAQLRKLQVEFTGGYHPIGYPLFLESIANFQDYLDGDNNRTNNDVLARHESVFFVINRATGDFIRVNMRQLSNASEILRARIDLVPDNDRRTVDPVARRTRENLANLGVDRDLLDSLYRNARNEDLAALSGRKYQGAATSLGASSSGAAVQYNQLQGANPIGLPTDTDNGNFVTYFAGEKYDALPVANGDSVIIVSRSVLWKDGVDAALATGIFFKVTNSVAAPQILGDKQTLESITTPEYANTVFLREDIEYPVDASVTLQPNQRRRIFEMTAIDTNRFWDPRVILFPNDTNYTELEFVTNASVVIKDGQSSLNHWLEVSLKDTTLANGESRVLFLKGKPTNPYVVPGGDSVTVQVRNWAPNRELMARLRATLLNDGWSAEEADFELAKYFYTFKSQLNAEVYNGPLARYLQQDTINVGAAATAEYTFRIIVVDSLPTFQQTVTKFGFDEVLVANVTDSLRFDVDFQTDDELEDADAEVKGWDFRYGRTAYAFQSFGVVPGRDSASDNISVLRPNWLGDSYLWNPDAAEFDPFAAAFTGAGKLSARIARDSATTLLTPNPQVHDALNLDTIITVVVNDGHGGINTITRPVIINYSPTILTANLEPATEGTDYNPDLLNPERGIQVYDPNFGQNMRFELLRAGDRNREILRDSVYPEAGNWNAIVANANTPEWLKIDPISGRLYGTPDVTDVPERSPVTVTITVLVTDPFGLTDVRELTLVINPINREPIVRESAQVRCLSVGGALDVDFFVIDGDLRRDEKDDYTYTVLEPANNNFQFTEGAIRNDSLSVKLTGTVPADTDGDGFVEVVVVVTDAGIAPNFPPASDTLRLQIAVSDATDFISTITVSNSLGAFQELEWGTDQFPRATTGEQDLGLDRIGKLDTNHCEYELPPLPFTDVFDTRWNISTREGVLRNIVPRAQNGERFLPLTGVIQAGGVNGNTSPAYPITIEFKKLASEAYASHDFYIQDAGGGTRFKVNMRLGTATSLADDITLTENGDDISLLIRNTSINAFQIVVDETRLVSVDDDAVAGFALMQNYPNPVQGETSISFSLPVASNTTIEVFDLVGNKVATVVNGMFNAGSHTVKWNGKSANGNDLASGMYVYKMTTGTNVITKQMIINR